MKNQTINNEKAKTKKRLNFKKAIPFLILILLLVVIVLPLSYKIKEKKEALLLSQSQDQDKAQGAEKALSNVITFAPFPSPIREKISFPGIVKPWISLEVVAELMGKIVHTVKVQVHVFSQNGKAIAIQEDVAASKGGRAKSKKILHVFDAEILDGADKLYWFFARDFGDRVKGVIEGRRK